jgi:sec-independent protein translocase protein TatA
MLENRVLELLIVLLVVMVLFGAKRLPDTARSLGKSLRILKAESRAMAEDGKTPQVIAQFEAEEEAGETGETGKAGQATPGTADEAVGARVR